MWVLTQITARTSVGGTESVKSMEYILEAAATDMAITAFPANLFSPFGLVQSCTNPN